MAVDASELHTFWEKAQKMDRVTGGDLFEVRDTIEKPTQRAPRTPNNASSSFPVRYGGGWRDGDCHRGGGFWLVTSSKPQPAAVSAAEAAPPQEMRETPSRAKRSRAWG
jgi:hypothetical protein